MKIPFVTKEKLDAIDQEYQYVQMGNNYKTTGKWSYDDKAKLVILYDDAGNQISTLYVKREGLGKTSTAMGSGLTPAKLWLTLG